MNEMFKNIKFLKLYGWVDWYRQRIDKVKVESVKMEKKSLERYIVLDAFRSVANQLIPVVTFSVFVGLGNTLDLAMVIVAQDYFFRLAPILTALPNLWKSYRDIQTGLERIDSFLKMPDV
jgi:ABC-type bacteriocin/lantibiotic exporter with double-glycine peptidase domain